MKFCICKLLTPKFMLISPSDSAYKTSGQTIRACLGSWIGSSLDVGKCFVLSGPFPKFQSSFNPQTFGTSLK